MVLRKRDIDPREGEQKNEGGIVAVGLRDQPSGDKKKEVGTENFLLGTGIISRAHRSSVSYGPERTNR